MSANAPIDVLETIAVLESCRRQNPAIWKGLCGAKHRLERDLSGNRLDSRKSSRRDGQGGKWP